MAERLLVTGAAGFVGSHVVRRLVQGGDDVLALVRPSSNLWRLEDVRSDVEVHELDLAAGRRVGVGRVDRVLHLAAAGVTGSTDERAIVRTNVLGTQVALDLARAGRASSFLYCGSCFEYGPGEGHREDDLPRPISAYGASKTGGWILAQAYGREHGLDVRGVRPFTVYGPYEDDSRLIPSVCLGAIRGGVVELTHGAQTRDFVFVDDAVEAIVLASSAPSAQLFNICTGSAVAVRMVAEELAKIATGGIELRFGALPTRAVEFPVLSGDPTLAREVLRWTAVTPLADGLRRTLEWFAHRTRPTLVLDARGGRR